MIFRFSSFFLRLIFCTIFLSSLFTACQKSNSSGIDPIPASNLGSQQDIASDFRENATSSFQDNLFSWYTPLKNSPQSLIKMSTFEQNLYYHSNGFLHQIDINDGLEKWKKPLNLDFSVHQILAGQQSLVFFGNKEGKDCVECWSIEPLQQKWFQDMDHPRVESLILYKDLLLYGSFSGYIYALNITDGSLQWRLSLEEVGKEFYSQQNTEEIKSYRSSDVKYQEKEVHPINLSSKLWIKNDVLFFYYNGELPNYYPDNPSIVYAISLEKAGLIWKTLLPEAINSDLLFDESKQSIWFSTSSSLYQLIMNDGSITTQACDFLSYPNPHLMDIADSFFILDGSSFVSAVPRSEAKSVSWKFDQFEVKGRDLRWIHHVLSIHPSLSKVNDRIQVLVLQRDTHHIYCFEASSGKVILHWDAQTYTDSLFVNQDKLVILNRQGIYALDLKKVLTRWLEAKETIEIVTRGE